MRKRAMFTFCYKENVSAPEFVLVATNVIENVNTVKIKMAHRIGSRARLKTPANIERQYKNPSKTPHLFCLDRSLR